MSRARLNALAAAALGALMLGAAPAQAQDVRFSFGFGDVRPRYDHYDRSYGYRPTRYYHRSYDHDMRPYRRAWVDDDDDVEECRTIVKRRYNRFGELVIKHVRICD